MCSVFLNLNFLMHKIDFRYLTPKVRLFASDLDDAQLRSRSFHLLCAPPRAIQMVKEIQQSISHRRPPIIVWEPVPGNCKPQDLPGCLETLKYVDVISPNYAEAIEFWGIDVADETGAEQAAHNFLKSPIGREGKGCIIIRTGQLGCLLGFKGGHGQDELRYFPAYYDGRSSKVRDPTGAGNAFCGALATTLAHGSSIEVSIIMATVVASFIVEQIGLPMLEKHEIWNGESVRSRCEQYQQRLNMTVDGLAELLSRLWPG